MRCLDVVWMVVSPRSSHPFGIFVVWHDVVAVGEFLVANGTLPTLLDNFAIQQFPHFCWRPEFAISSWVMRILDSLNTQLYSTFLPSLLPAAAEEGPMDRTILVATEFHGFLLVRPLLLRLIVNSLEKEDSRGWLDALLASGYYLAETVAAPTVVSGALALRAYAAHNA